jgi:hypothetical protein
MVTNGLPQIARGIPSNSRGTGARLASGTRPDRARRRLRLRPRRDHARRRPGRADGERIAADGKAADGE